jgi:hypothetical protein
MPDDKHAYIALHTLTQAAIIYLYHPSGPEDPVLYEKCLRAVQCCVANTKHISAADYDFLDPILGISAGCLTS